MEEIINIIKEIKKMEKANDELKVNPIRDERAVTHYETIDNKLTNEVVATKENVDEAKKEYDNSKEGNLLRELDETRDVYRRKELIEEIKQVRIEKMKALQRQLNKEKANISKNVEQNKQLIDANKNEMYRMKANRDKLKDENGIIRAEWQNAYVEMTKQIMEKRNENIELNKNVKELEVLLKDIRERKFDKILTENSIDNHQKPAEQKPVEQKPVEQKSTEQQVAQQIIDEEEAAWEARKHEERYEEALQAGVAYYDTKMAWADKEAAEAAEEIEAQEQAAKEIEEWDKEEDKREQEELNQNPKPQKPGIAQGFINQLNEEEEEVEQTLESEDKITIYPHNVEVTNTSGEKLAIDLDHVTEEEKTALKNLSDETYNKLDSFQGEIDFAIVKALLMTDEKVLNDYLDLCSLYNNKYDTNPEVENAIENYKLPEDFPKIEYNFKDLRKDKNMSNEQKLEMYAEAKDTINMFKYMNVKDKVSMKMSFIDKAYFGVMNFVNIFKKEKALPPAVEDNTHEVEQNANIEPQKTTSVKYKYRVSNLPPVKRPTEPTKTTEKTDGSR